MSGELTNFEISLMRQRGWDTDKERLLREIRWLQVALGNAHDGLDSAATANRMLKEQIKELEAELKTIHDLGRTE